MKTRMFLLLMLIGLMSCQKKLDLIPDKTLYPITFTPYLYGQVIPNMKDSTAKGFVDFTHKFLLHVIRLRTAAGVFVTDIPIVTPSASGTYTYSMTVGDYTAEVIPITEPTISGNGPFTPFDVTDINWFSINRAAIGTTAPVAFSITGGAAVPVVLDCVTSYRALEFDLQGQDYVSAVMPRPNVVNDYNNSFIAGHSVAGSEWASYVELRSELSSHNINTMLATSTPASWIVQNQFSWDPVSHLYYLYTNASYPNYLCFDLVGGTGSTMPVIWLKDAYPSQTWVANTTMRVTYTGGTFQVNQSDWFGTIITK